MTYTDLIEKHPHIAEAARERLDIMVVEGMPELEAMQRIADDYPKRYRLFEQADLFKNI